MAAGPRLLLLDEPAAGPQRRGGAPARRDRPVDPGQRRHRRPHRAQHGPGHVAVRTGHRAGQRQRHRRGHPAEVAATPRSSRPTSAGRRCPHRRTARAGGLPDVAHGGDPMSAGSAAPPRVPSHRRSCGQRPHGHYGGVCAVRRSASPSAGGTVGRRDRRQRRRQDLDAEGPHGPGAAAAGALRFGDRDLTRVPARDMVRHGIGYVPEGRHVFAGLSVEKNLLLGAYARRGTARPGTPSTRSTSCSRCSARCATGWPARCPAASSRCWRSAAR